MDFKGRKPKIDPNTYIAPNVTIIGDVRIASGVNIWPGVVLRGDINYIEIGENTNIQDGTVVHVDRNCPTIIGKNVTVGHASVLHGCTIGDRCLIGMGATVLDEAIVEDDSVVGANALITQKKRVASKTLWGGVPAKKLRVLGDEEVEFLLKSAEHYVSLSREYMK